MLTTKIERSEKSNLLPTVSKVVEKNPLKKAHPNG
jgi:hypothetical protein